MKSILKTLLLLIVIAAIGGGYWVYTRYTHMVSTFKTLEIKDINLTGLHDGLYTGEFGEFLVSVKADVTITKNRISEVRISRQRCGKSYEASDTLNRIMKAQTPRVDAVAGATASSKAIMAAVQKALENPPLK